MPYFIAASFAFPQADDFCMSLLVKQHPTLFDFLTHCYLKLNGRILTDSIFYYAPTNYASLFGYQFAAISILILFLVSLFTLSKIIFQGQSLYALIFSLVITTLSWDIFPNLSEAIYWFGGSWNYTFGTLVFFIMMAIFLRWQSTKSKILLLLLIIFQAICVACTELHLMITVGIFTMIFLTHSVVEGKIDKTLLLILASILTVSTVLSLAPGNFNRFGLFPVERDYPNILLMSLLNIIRFSGLWIINPASIAVGVFIVLFTKAIEPHIKFKAISIYPIIAFMAILMLSAIFVPTYISGIIGQHRTVNAVLPIFLCCWFLLLFQLGLQIKITHPKWLSAPLLFAFFWLSITFTGNHKTLLFQLADGTIQKSFHEQFNRQTDILHATTYNLDEVKPMSKKSIIVNYDITPGKWSFMNVCQQEYAKEIGIIK